MIKRLAGGCIAALFLALSAASFAEGMPYGHMHLIATNPTEAFEWYMKYMDGETTGSDNRLRFGTTLVIFLEREAGFEGSEGSSVDHIGFSLAIRAFKEST